ncbi:MAG TPA: FAD-dependent oxidoreductase [Holophagaceae bacterium]|nr:FAD-dependent oxidoreductase [Holophagaceae bacterium]
MARDPRFDILFEPIRIGPVTAPNRFYQVPHCNGMGYRLPKSLAALREIKAEGGWGVVCTEEIEIHHSGDIAPCFEGHLWDDEDIPALALMAESVHKHGSLAGIELVHNGVDAPNYFSRAVPLGPRSMSVIGGTGYEPGQTRRMDKADLRAVRRWHRNAALRAKHAGFDLIYCYAGHNLTLFMHFLSKRTNDRTDEYGGSLENRVRFFREMIEDTKEAVGDACGIVIRLAVEELLGSDGIRSHEEGREIVSMLAELPDLWDVNVAGWSNDSATSRFEKEGYQEPHIAFVKSLTSKPVVGVGRYTSPDAMVDAIRHGIMDMVGSARPSIADPFLPNKIKEGRVDDIRECIGCNICVMADNKIVPIRCTQNPTMGEEWRRDWHPERIARKASESQILVIGAGPAGLEAARALGQRGYEVILAEATRKLGGRVELEANLPGLSEWRRVAEWRTTQLKQLPNVEVHLESRIDAEQVRDFGFRNVIVATGSTWRRDGVGRAHYQPIPGVDSVPVFTPDDLMAGRLPQGRVLVFDDDHYCMGGVLAELLAKQGCTVTVATTAPLVSMWSQYTLEQHRIEKRLRELGVEIATQRLLKSLAPGQARLACTTTGREWELPLDAVVLVTDRLPNEELFLELQPLLAEGTLDSLVRIGDCEAPGLIATAVFAGHKAAREFDTTVDPDVTPFRQERPNAKRD